jgi:hypothetical protein
MHKQQGPIHTSPGGCHQAMSGDGRPTSTNQQPEAAVAEASLWVTGMGKKAKGERHKASEGKRCAGGPGEGQGPGHSWPFY